MSDKDKGFASMDKEKVRDIAHKGGEARKKQLGPEGYAELGSKGGSANKNKNNEDNDKDDDNENNKDKKDNRGNNRK